MGVFCPLAAFGIIALLVGGMMLTKPTQRERGIRWIVVGVTSLGVFLYILKDWNDTMIRVWRNAPATSGQSP